MATDDQTRRESQVDDVSPESGDAGAPVEPDVELSRDEGGAPVVEEGRRERRERERQEKRRKEYEEFNRPLAEQLTSLSKTVQSLNAALLARQTQAPVTPTAHSEDDDPQHDAIRERQGDLYARYSKAVADGDAEKAEKLAKEFNRLDRQAIRLAAKSERETMRNEILQELETHMARREPEGIVAAKQKYSHVMSNDLAKEYARGLHLQEEALARREGRTIDQTETFIKCVKAAGVRFGLIREDLPPARPGEQARFGGAPPASNGRGAPFKRPLTEAERGFAHAMNPEMSEAEAEDAWVKGTLRTNPNYFRE